VEGEFNQLQLQSLSRRERERAKEKGRAYVFCAAVGSVSGADIDECPVLQRKQLSVTTMTRAGPVFGLVEALQEKLTVEAFTTPGTAPTWIRTSGVTVTMLKRLTVE